MNPNGCVVHECHEPVVTALHTRRDDCDVVWPVCAGHRPDVAALLRSDLLDDLIANPAKEPR